MQTSPSKKVILGVIGGSGVYKLKNAKVIGEHFITTPFGEPSDAILECEISGKRVYFLPRHGRGHVFTPSEVNTRANIYALKIFGVTYVLAVSACGIMQENIKPGDMVIPDQIFDRTSGMRKNSFFGNGVVGHVAFADPFCSELRKIIYDAAVGSGVNVHQKGTYVCIEGPTFSSRAESHFYRKTLSPAVIGMTAIPEAKLAREAEMCYGMLALATDYDCWNEHEEDVSVEAVMAVVNANSEKANSIVERVCEILPETSSSPILYAAQYAIMTDRAKIAVKAKNELSLLYSRYF